MYYESSDFLETADSDTLKQIARTRELTRKYYFSDYRDTEKRNFHSSGAVGRNRGKCGNRHAFSLRLWKKYFFGK